jgi:hypothetical protein
LRAPQDEMNVFEAELVRGLPVEAGNEPAVLLPRPQNHDRHDAFACELQLGRCLFRCFPWGNAALMDRFLQTIPLQIPLGHFRRGRKFA